MLLTQGTLHDQKYYAMPGGEILTAHGPTHPDGFVVGELSYAPDPEGPYHIFGIRYGKPYQRNGTGIPEHLRPRVRVPTGTFFDRAHMFASKSIVPTDCLTEVPTRSYSSVFDECAPKVEDAVGNVLLAQREILGSAFRDVDVSITGSISLGSVRKSIGEVHDVDLVYCGGLEENAAVRRLLALNTGERKSARVHEYGKKWRIRTRILNGILCPFFVYRDPGDSPLSNLETVEHFGTSTLVRGEVVSDLHSGYLPSIVTVKVRDSSSSSVQPGSLIEIIMYHMRSRGDFQVGDIGLFYGQPIALHTVRGGSRPALSVIDGNSSVDETLECQH